MYVFLTILISLSKSFLGYNKLKKNFKQVNRYKNSLLIRSILWGRKKNKNKNKNGWLSGWNTNQITKSPNPMAWSEIGSHPICKNLQYEVFHSTKTATTVPVHG